MTSARNDTTPAATAATTAAPTDESPEEAPEVVRKVRVLLVDDQEPVRRGLKMRLEVEPDLEVVGEAADGREVVEAVLELAPDVVLMDLAMRVVDGIAATAALRAAAPRVAVVMLSLHDDAETRERALEAGAAGFVGKHEAERKLVEEIRRAYGSTSPKHRVPLER